MEKIQFDNDNFILYSPDTLKYVTDGMESILNNTLDLYKKIFDIDSYRKVQINLFDNQDIFREFVYEIRGEKTSLPKYASGTFDKGMINIYVPTNIVVNSPLYYLYKYSPSHELFHIMYKELVLTKENLQRIVWFDEGVAQFLSGDHPIELSEENYSSFEEKVFSNTKILPKINELEHGTSFFNQDYDGYKLGLILVKHIYDEIGLDGLKLLIHDINKIKEYGNTLLPKLFEDHKGKGLK